MKKGLLIVLCLVLCGCNFNKEKVLTCTKKEDNTLLTSTINYKNNKISKVKNKTTITIKENEMKFYKKIYSDLAKSYENNKEVNIETKFNKNKVISTITVNYKSDNKPILKKYKNKYLKKYTCK